MLAHIPCRYINRKLQAVHHQNATSHGEIKSSGYACHKKEKGGKTHRNGKYTYTSSRPPHTIRVMLSFEITLHCLSSLRTRKNESQNSLQRMWRRNSSSWVMTMS